MSDIYNSSSCAEDISEGLSAIRSLALLFLGKAIKSLIVSIPPNMEHILSKPNAIPPWGGAPYSKGFLKTRQEPISRRNAQSEARTLSVFRCHFVKQKCGYLPFFGIFNPSIAV